MNCFESCTQRLKAELSDELKIGPNSIKLINLIYETFCTSISHSEYTKSSKSISRIVNTRLNCFNKKNEKSDVAIKSFLRLDNEEITEIYPNPKLYSFQFHSFINEIKTYQILQKLEINKKEGSQFIAKFLGCIFYEKSSPVCLSIMLKYYPIGNLQRFCFDINKKLWDVTKYDMTKFKSEFCSEEMQKDVCQFVEFANQIAKGYFLL